MSAQAATTREFSIDTFMKLFISALALRGKRHIYIRREGANEERRRMYKLYEHLEEVVSAADKAEKDWRYFIVRLRNELSPGNIGAFDYFYHQFRRLQLTLTGIDWPDCNYFKLELADCTARCFLDQADPEFRAFVEKCADVYVAPAEKR